jgi:crotonobetainyl-CoA:carnitine CoA-transferase CaiB-like acyl-CoA transferase
VAESVDARALRGLRVVDLGLGMACALISKQLAEMGMAVSRVEPEGGDPFTDTYPAYSVWRRHVAGRSRDTLADLLAAADVCVIGGEDFPGYEREWDAHALSRSHPRLIVLDVTAYPQGRDEGARSADVLVQARTGVAWEQYSERPVHMGLPMPSYGAMLVGLIGVLVALIHRERTGSGQVVSASLEGGAASLLAPFWMDAERPDERFVAITPRDVRQLILPCADGKYVQIVIRGAVRKVYGILGIAKLPDDGDSGMPDHSRGPANFYGDYDLLAAHSRQLSSSLLIRALHEAEVPAEPVLAPGGNWDDEQVRASGILETDAAGRRYVGNPIRVAYAEPHAHSSAPDWPADPEPGSPPLSGLRVVDFGIFVAGPYASKLLADYGADVVCVEPPGSRSTLSGARTIITAFHGKRSVFIDLKSDRGRKMVECLCKNAHVALNNFRPGTSARLGLDPQALRELNPHIITLETTAYGSRGPKAHAPGFDMILQAWCGLEQRAGGDGNVPICSRSPLVDFAAGAIGAIGVLAAVYERMRTGRAASVETSLLNVGLHMMSELVQTPEGGFVGALSTDSAQCGPHPAESLYRTRDGWLALCVRSSDMAEALGRLLAVVLAPNFRRWGTRERDVLAGSLATRATAELLKQLGDAGIWAEQCLMDPWRGRPSDGTVFRRMHDDTYGEVIHCLGPLVKFSGSLMRLATRLDTPPGTDSRAILREAGASADQLAAWGLEADGNNDGARASGSNAGCTR